MAILLVIGLGIVSYGTFTWLTASHGTTTQLLGLIIFFESLLFLIGIHSHWRTWKDYWLHLLFLILLGCIVGFFFFDLPALFIFKVWSFPVFSPITDPAGYLLRVVIGWGLFFLVFHDSFLVANHLLQRKHHHMILAKNESDFLFVWIGFGGIVLMILGVALLLAGNNTMLPIAIAIIGVWFVLEGFEFPRKRPTLLYDLMNGEFRSLCAIIIAGFFLGFLFEYSNIVTPIHEWIYYKVPWPQLNLFGVPISILFGWAAMYIIFLSLENILLKRNEDLWQ
jgi:hypothetical protein